MPNIETPPELADHLADLLGIYGACTENHPENSPNCRVCFVSGMTERIRQAVLNEDLLHGDAA